MTIVIAADHRGFAHAHRLARNLEAQGHTVVQCVSAAYDPQDDYTDYVARARAYLHENHDARGIFLCGSGVGVSIAANRDPFLRAGLAITPVQIAHATADEHLNVLCLSAESMQDAEIDACVNVFLETPWRTEERYMRRIAALTA